MYGIIFKLMSHIKHLGNEIYQTKFNPLFGLPVGDNTPEEINMLVETPMGSINKYEFNTQTGLIKLDRVLYSKLPYPVEYGAIPQTWDEDEDMLDVMCLVNYPTFPGCLISVKPIGVMLFNDSGQRDDKILAIPANDIRFIHINELSDLTEHQKDEITFFMERYKDLQFKYRKQPDNKLVVEGWEGKERAHEIIKESHELFNKHFALAPLSG